MALDISQNFVSAQYRKNERMELSRFCIHFDIEEI